MGGVSGGNKQNFVGAIWRHLDLESRHRYLLKLRFMHWHRQELLGDCKCWNTHPIMNYYLDRIFVGYLVRNKIIAAYYWQVLNGDSLTDEMYKSGIWDDFSDLFIAKMCQN